MMNELYHYGVKGMKWGKRKKGGATTVAVKIRMLPSKSESAVVSEKGAKTAAKTIRKNTSEKAIKKYRRQKLLNIPKSTLDKGRQAWQKRKRRKAVMQRHHSQVSTREHRKTIAEGYHKNGNYDDTLYFK